MHCTTFLWTDIVPKTKQTTPLQTSRITSVVFEGFAVVRKAPHEARNEIVCPLSYRMDRFVPSKALHKIQLYIVSSPCTTAGFFHAHPHKLNPSLIQGKDVHVIGMMTSAPEHEGAFVDSKIAIWERRHGLGPRRRFQKDLATQMGKRLNFPFLEPSITVLSQAESSKIRGH